MMRPNFNDDAVDCVVNLAIQKLAVYLLGPERPPDLRATELELLIHLGKGLNNHQIAALINKPSTTVANRVALLSKRTKMLRPRLALYGAILGLGITVRGDMPKPSRQEYDDFWDDDSEDDNVDSTLEPQQAI